MIIGVFDSGIGGLSVANAIKKAMPEHEIRFVNDREHVPYGTKTKQELLKLALPILTSMQAGGCQVIVIACNTLSTTLISDLRAKLSVPLVAIEPMVKPAANMTKTGVIGVCATPATLASNRYAQLKQDYADGIKVIEPDCSNWAELIERDRIDRKQIKSTVDDLILKGVDVIVLGCTHYHWIEEDVRKWADGKAEVIQPEEAIIRRLRHTLEQLA